jgi:hypothetical protein
MTPLRSCDDINGFCDGNIFNTVTEESGLFMDKTPPCDDSDGNTDIIPTSYEGEATQPQLGEYENNTDNTVTPSHPAQNTCKTQHSNCDDIENITVTDTSNTVTTPLEVPEFIRRSIESQREQADALGLVARWSRQFGYIAIHDPTTAEWAKSEAFLRARLRKVRGITRLMSRAELEQVWAGELPPVAPLSKPAAVTKHGIVYEDYLEE